MVRKLGAIALIVFAAFTQFTVHGIAADLTVMSSGGYTAALKAIAADYEKETGNHLNIVLGPSMGTAPEAI